MIKESIPYKDIKHVMSLLKDGKYGTYEKILEGVKEYLGKQRHKPMDKNYFEAIAEKLIVDGYIEKDREGSYTLTGNGIILQKKLKTFIWIIEFRLRDKRLTITFIVSVVSLIISIIALLK